MALSHRPTIVVVPGAFHTPVHFQRVTGLLEASGYRVTGATFPVPGKWHAQDASFDELVDLVRVIIKNELDDGRDVLLVVHSAGALLGAAAMDGLTKKKGSNQPGVIGFFAIAAIFGQAGLSLVDIVRGGGASWWTLDGNILYPRGFDTQGETPTLLGPVVCSTATALYNDMSEKEQKEAFDALEPIFFSTFTGVPKSAAWKEVPITYVITERDLALFPILQGGIIVMLDVPVDIKRIDTSHSPFISQPKQIADWIIEAATQASAKST